MKHVIAGLGAATLLVTLLTGCTQLVPDSGARTADPSLELPSPTLDATPEATDRPGDFPVIPEPMPFTTYPARPTSKVKVQSIAAELKAGKHPLDRAVPGSERVMLSERFIGPRELFTPAGTPGEAMAWSVSCLGGGQVSLEISDDSGFSYGWQVACSPDRQGSSQSALFGAGLARIEVERDAEILLELVAFTEESPFDDEEETIASVGRMEGVDADSVMVLADAQFTGPDELSLPKARTGTHLMALLSCPRQGLVPLRLADANGPLTRTEYLGECLSGEAAGSATWEDPDPARALKLVADLEPDRAMRLRVFSFFMEAGSGG